MKLNIIFPTITLATGYVDAMALAAAASSTAVHPCVAYSAKVSELHSCLSATSFCSSYLGGPATFTRTSTKVKTVASVVKTTVTEKTTSTSTTVVGTTTLTSYTSTTTVTTPTTTTTYDANCGSGRKLKARSPEAAAASSCGIGADANPLQVSGACECILAANTVVTSTTTVVASTSTTEKTKTVHASTSITSISTESIATVTVGQVVATTCASSFYLALGDVGDIYDGDLGDFHDFGSSINFLSFPGSASEDARAPLFELNGSGQVVSIDGVLTGNVGSSSNSDNGIAWDPVADQGPKARFLDCQISATQQLTCENGGESVFLFCDGLYLDLASPGSTECPEVDVYVVASDGN